MRIHEARRNPELNQKTDPLQQLQEYAGDEDVFVTFTSGFNVSAGNRKFKSGPRSKIGINPKSDYNTPLGIYCYPIDYIINFSKSNGELTGPYTGRNKWQFLYVIRRTTNNYVETDSDAESYLEKLKSFLEEAIPEQADRIIKSGAENANEQTTRGYLWNISRLAAESPAFKNQFNIKTSTVAWNFIMRKIGCMMFADRKGQGLIHGNEPTQAVFFSANQFNVVDVIKSSESKSVDERVLEKIIALIKKSAFKAENFNPKWLSLMSLHSKDFITVMKFLSENAKVIQHKAISESLKSRIDYLGSGANYELLDVVKGFIQLSMDNHGEALVGIPDISQIPALMGRELSNSDWVKLFRAIEERSWAPVMSLVTNGNDRDFAQLLLEKWLDFQGNYVHNYQYMEEALALLIDAFNLKLESDQTKKLFYKSPKLARKVDPEITSKLNNKDWLRTVRVTGIIDIVDDIPIDILKLAISSSDPVTSTFQRAIFRLMKEGEKAFALQTLLRLPRLDFVTHKDIIAFLWENVDKLIISLKNNRKGILPFITDSTPPDIWLKGPIRKILWANLKNDEMSAHALYSLVSNGLITINELKSNDGNPVVFKMYREALHKYRPLDSYITKLGHAYETLAKLDLEYLFSWAEKLGYGQYIAPRHLIEYFKGRPTELLNWRPAPMRYNYPDDLFTEIISKFPLALQNVVFLRKLNGSEMYDAVIEGKIDLSEMNEDDRLHVWIKVIGDDAYMMVKLFNDPRFQPTPPLQTLFRFMKWEVRRSLSKIPLPADMLYPLLSTRSLEEATVIPDQAEKLVELLINNDIQGSSFLYWLATGMQTVTIHNIPEHVTTRLQKLLISNRVRDIIPSIHTEYDSGDDVRKRFPSFLSNFLNSMREPTTETQAYVSAFVQAVNKYDFDQLKRLGEPELAAALKEKLDANS